MTIKLDLLGFGCAEALEKVERKCAKLGYDDILIVKFDCPCSAKTIPGWGRRNGYYVEMQSLDNGSYLCSLQRI